MNPADYFRLPEALLALPAVLLIWALLYWQDRRRAGKLARGLGERGSTLGTARGAAPRSKRRGLALSGLLLALLALAQPMWGEGAHDLEPRGIDLVICLDLSRSMLARDVEPDRLQRAKREIKALANRAQGNRLALVTFAGEARLVVPLTRDLGAFTSLLDEVNHLAVPRGGTDLGAALAMALEALAGRTGEHETILLVTDGEDLEGRGAAMASKCEERNITVHCVGFGTGPGSKIALQDQGEPAFLRDRTGLEVVSALDEAGLRGIAEATGGTFIKAADLAVPLCRLYDRRLLPMARQAFESDRRRARKNRFQWPLFAAFLLLLMELALLDGRRK